MLHPGDIVTHPAVVLFDEGRMLPAPLIVVWAKPWRRTQRVFATARRHNPDGSLYGMIDLAEHFGVEGPVQ